MRNQKKEKKISIYDLEKQDIKLNSLIQRFQYLKYTFDDLKERFNIEYKLYQDALEKLEIQEKKASEIPQYKKDVEKMNSLEKKKKESILNLERLKSELQSIKQTLDEYEDKKKKLKEKCNILQKENEKLKNDEESLDTAINTSLIEKKGLEERLEEKIRDEIELRKFYEDEFKKYKEKKKEFIPPNKSFDIMINGMNNNNNLYELNLSNVEENPENKKEDNSILSDNMNIKSIKSFEEKSGTQTNNKKINQEDNVENNNKVNNINDNTDNLYSSKNE